MVTAGKLRIPPSEVEVNLGLAANEDLVPDIDLREQALAPSEGDHELGAGGLERLFEHHLLIVGVGRRETSREPIAYGTVVGYRVALCGVKIQRLNEVIPGAYTVAPETGRRRTLDDAWPAPIAPRQALPLHPGR